MVERSKIIILSVKLDSDLQTSSEEFVVEEVSFTYAWEPDFVAHHSLPYHDETIQYKDSDHVSWVCLAVYKCEIF